METGSSSHRFQRSICRDSFGRLHLKLGPAPMAHSYRLGPGTWRYQGQTPVGPDICHRGCAYTVIPTVRRYGVYSVVYGTLHYKEHLKSFEKRVGYSPGLPDVAILPQCAESDIKQ